MRTDAPLNFRYQDILTSIVRAYIDTGEPVGSHTISKRRHNTLSPASIRNVMADLVEEGYLSQPHTSAGRVPTEKAFRFFVGSLATSRVTATESDRMTNEFRALDTVGERVARSSYILVELTRNVGIAAAIPEMAQELDQIQLVPLSDRRVLMVLVTRDHMVRNRVVMLEEPTSPDELTSICNYVNRNFSGWQLGTARRELLRRIESERELYHAAMHNLQMLSQKGLLDLSPGSHGRRQQPAGAGPAPDARENARTLPCLGRKAASHGVAGPLPGTASRRVGGPCRAGGSPPGDERPRADWNDHPHGQRIARKSSRAGPHAYEL